MPVEARAVVDVVLALTGLALFATPFVEEVDAALGRAVVAVDVVDAELGVRACVAGLLGAGPFEDAGTAVFLTDEALVVPAMAAAGLDDDGPPDELRRELAAGRAEVVFVVGASEVRF